MKLPETTLGRRTFTNSPRKGRSTTQPPNSGSLVILISGEQGESTCCVPGKRFTLLDWISVGYTHAGYSSLNSKSRRPGRPSPGVYFVGCLAHTHQRLCVVVDPAHTLPRIQIHVTGKPSLQQPLLGNWGPRWDWLTYVVVNTVCL